MGSTQQHGSKGHSCGWRDRHPLRPSPGRRHRQHRPAPGHPAVRDHPGRLPRAAALAALARRGGPGCRDRGDSCLCHGGRPVPHRERGHGGGGEPAGPQDTRRDNGKSDCIDAYAATTAVLSGRAAGTPTARNGIVEAIRALRVVRKSAVKARTQTINQIRTLIVTAPSEVRDRSRGLSARELVDTLARSRPAGELATSAPRSTSPGAPPKACPRRTSSAASNGSSPARSTATYLT